MARCWPAGTAHRTPEEPPPEIAGYRILGEIGRGATGAVYRAIQPRLESEIALKVLSAGPFASPKARAHFLAEARAAAALHHPNIIAIHDVGEDDGVPWLAMTLVAGGDLASCQRQGPRGPREAAALARSLADAVAHAHASGIAHYDLKPANVLLDAVTGCPVIADFGLAGAELLGHCAGTPGFSAPEQLRGTVAEDARFAADIYGLGAVLYFALTGRAPHQASSLPQLLASIESEPPLPPRRLTDGVPRALETICLKCLAKDPADRYSGAAALRDDLDRFLEGAPIMARPPSALHRAAYWRRRHPTAAMLLAVGFIALASFVASVLWISRERVRENHRFALIAEARSSRALRDGPARSRALEALREAWGIRPAPSIRDEAIATLALIEIADLGGVGDLPPDAIAPSDWATIAPDGSTLVLSGAPPVELRHPAPIHSFDRAGDLIAVATTDRMISIWTTDGRRRHRLAGHEGDHIQVRFRPRSQDLVSVANDRWVRVWQAALGTEIARLAAPEDHAAPVWFAEDDRLCAGSAQGTRAYRVSPSPCAAVLAPPEADPHPENLRTASLDPSGRFAAVSDGTCCRVWDFLSGRLVATFPKTPGEWTLSRFSNDGGSVWTGGWNRGLAEHSLLVADASLAEPRQRLGTSGYLLYGFSNDNQALLVNTHGKIGHLALLDPATGEQRKFSFRDCLAAALSPDGSWLAASDYLDPPRLALWRLPATKPARDLRLPATGISLIFEHGGDSLLVFTEAGVFRMRTADGTPGAPMRADTVLRSPVADPAGRYLAAVAEGVIVLLDPESLAEFARLPLPRDSGPSAMAQLANDASGDFLLAHLPLGTVVRWELRNLAGELSDLRMEGDFLRLPRPPRN